MSLFSENEESFSVLYFKLFTPVTGQLKIFQNHFETSKFASNHHNQNFGSLRISNIRVSVSGSIEGDTSVWKKYFYEI